MNIKRRIKKAEERLRIDRDDERVTLDFGDGQVWEGTERELGEVIREVRRTSGGLAEIMREAHRIRHSSGGLLSG
jgi:hypothetical protein